jgi:16S rRNA (adenine1518-N6/adenine1519-N6)-dimethyltransferase
MSRPPRSLPPPLKRLGQHFLADRVALRRIADALDLSPNDTVVEVGPGRGALTDLLAARVIAIELDRALVPILRERYAAMPHVEIIESDVLKLDLGHVAGGPYVLAGNVPYYITTPIIFHALVPPRPKRAVFLMQREVAERIVAPPGGEAYGALSVNVQALAHGEIIARVPAGAFTPRPSVESAILRLTPLADAIVQPHEEVPFSKLVQGAFGQRRRQMRRVLRTIRSLDAERAAAALTASGIAEDARPETLAPADFVRLLRALDA